MIFTEPKPFAEALEADAVRVLLPTELRTRDLARIEPELLQRARFSAGVVQADFLQRIDDRIERLVRGDTDRASARTELKRFLGSLGADVDETDLTDLRSDARLNLILDTNLKQAQGYGYWKQGQDPAILDQWPAQELYRATARKSPRDWSQRWADAGGRFFGGRMIALVNDPIWSRISRFGQPWPPFDFNSGMEVRDISRDEAIDLGVIEEDYQPTPDTTHDFNAELQATPDVRADWLRSALTENLAGIATFVGGVLRLVGGRA